MDNVIESKDNSKVKRIAKLSQKKFRDQEGLLIVEGLRSVLQAIENKATIELIAFDQNLLAQKEELQGLFEAHNSVVIKSSIFESLSDTVNSQGILALVKKPKYTLEELYSAKRLLLLDRVQDPGNLGTLIRTADAAGFDGVLCTKGTVDVFSPKVNRSAMGSNLYLPIFTVEEEQIHQLKKQGFTVFAALLDQEAKSYRQVAYGPKAIIALGNEANGLQDAIIQIADHHVFIPIHGQAESLNVAIAGAILMYQAIE